MTAIEAEKTGRDVVAAHRYLAEIYAQIRGFLKSCDSMMAKQGWSPTDAKNVTYDLGPSMREDHAWLATWFLRFYCNFTLDSRTVCGCEIYLDPPPGFETPTCLVFAAHLRENLNHKVIWQEWNDTSLLIDTVRNVTSVVTDQMRQVGRDSVATCMPLASEFACAAVPLCELADEADLESRIIRPMLKIAVEMSRPKQRTGVRKPSTSRKGSK